LGKLINEITSSDMLPPGTIVPKIKEILNERRQQGIPAATLRGISFILVSLGHIEKIWQQYKRSFDTEFSAVIFSATSNSRNLKMTGPVNKTKVVYILMYHFVLVGALSLHNLLYY
jgi:hypothetical protein